MIRPEDPLGRYYTENEAREYGKEIVMQHLNELYRQSFKTMVEAGLYFQGYKTALENLKDKLENK